MRYCMTTFTITVVYGPSTRAEKVSFLQHLCGLKPDHDSKWLILGDFNLIYKARDKNSRILNLRLMSFRHAMISAGSRSCGYKTKSSLGATNAADQLWSCWTALSATRIGTWPSTPARHTPSPTPILITVRSFSRVMQAHSALRRSNSRTSGHVSQISKKRCLRHGMPQQLIPSLSTDWATNCTLRPKH
jgi:hypothetical protein